MSSEAAELAREIALVERVVDANRRQLIATARDCGTEASGLFARRLVVAMRWRLRSAHASARFSWVHTGAPAEAESTTSASTKIEVCNDQAIRAPKVLPHGKLVQVDDDILTVTGEIAMPLMKFMRRMTVVRLSDGRLVIFSAIGARRG